MKKLLIAVPAYNEEQILEKNIRNLTFFLRRNLSLYDWKIIINNNSSNDQTGGVAEKLSSEIAEVETLHHPFRSMSRSIQKTWLTFDADIYVHIDADLSADLRYLPKLLKAIETGANIATGSRMTNQSKRTRGFIRELLSLGLVKIIQVVFRTSILDFQCGFKAIDKKTRNEIIPKMKCIEHGFMSTEMILVASQKKLKVQEIPITWNDTRKTKTKIIGSIFDALLNLCKIKIRLFFKNYD